MRQEALFPQPLHERLDVHVWEDLCQALAQGASVLTANKRLARSLLERYAVWCREQDKLVWPRVDILPWQSWCRRELEAPLTELVPQVLTEDQSERLWRRVIQSAPVDLGDERIQPAPTQCVKPAAAAWALLHTHAVPLEQLALQPDLEAELLGQWGQAYQQELQALQAVDQSQLADTLIQQFQRQQRTVPEQLIVAGFHELPPDLERLLQCLNQNGTRLGQLASPAQHGTAKPKCIVRQVAAADAEAETRAAAMWARRCIEDNPDSQVAVLVVDLAERRTMIERIFTEVLHPERLLEGGADTRKAFNISLGWPLAEEPLVHDALMALRWVIAPLDFESLSQLLRSPFWSVDEAAAAQLELRLRDINLAQASLEQVLFQAGGSESTRWRSASWASRWRRFRNTLLQAPERQSPLAWAELIATALTDLGLKQEDSAGRDQRHFSSREFQAFAAFHDCLETLAALDRVLPQCGLAQILTELQQLAQGQIFQPQQETAPILISEPLQVLGLRFDDIWLMGLTDENWPEPARPNPLLPHAIQREYNMPHATAAGQLKYVQTLLQWTLHSAPRVICSWPRLNGDQWLRPSPLIAGFQDQNTNAEAWHQAALVQREQMEDFAQGQCRRVVDEQAPAIPQVNQDAIEVSGGVSLIREQSACPFRALVSVRWRLQTPARVAGGLTAAQRGTLLHAALQLMYESSAGRLPPETQWAEAAAQAVSMALERQLKHWPVLQQSRLYSAEKKRLELAVTEWLAIDAAREMPFVNLSQEVQKSLMLGPLRLSLKVDRIDKLDDGRAVIIDYKGGQGHKASEWFGERPQEPQLPLYALALAEEMPLAALVFGNLKPGQRGYRGIAEADDLLPGVVPLEREKLSPTTQWDELKDYWRQHLSRLAQDYVDGQAQVAPRDGKVCQFCAFTALCRIHEQGSARNVDADANAGESVKLEINL